MYTNLAVIAIIHSVVSPLILPFAALTFASFFLVQRYKILHIASFNTDTGGLIYLKALYQLFLGLYVMECYLIGLFFLIRDEKGHVVCAGQGVIMIFTISLTATFHILLKQAYNPLAANAPVMLSTGTWGSMPTHCRTTSDGRRFQIMVEPLSRLTHQFLEEEISPLKDYEEAEALASDIKVDEIQDEALTAKQPTIWIPKDKLGVSRYEIQQTSHQDPHTAISDDCCVLDNQGKIQCTEKPCTIEGVD